MDSTFATIMYYLLHILAVFGLIFLLILLVRVTLWCLMCNLKNEKKRKRTQKKLKSLQKAEEGRNGNVQALRRSPNVQRLNLIKPEDDKKFSDTLKKLEPSSSSSSSEVPPTPPPKDIEALDEKVQQNSAENAVYATLAFTGIAKRKAPSPPAQRVSCICPFCSSMKKAKFNAEQSTEEDKEIKAISCEATQATTELDLALTVEVTDAEESVAVAESASDDGFAATEDQSGETTDEPEPTELPLPQTPEAPASLSSSSESLQTQNALNSLDQAIEELDDVIQDLTEVDEEANPEPESTQGELEDHEESAQPEKEATSEPNEKELETEQFLNPTTTVVTVEINEVIEPDNSVLNSVSENEPQVNDSIENEPNVEELSASAPEPVEVTPDPIGNEETVTETENEPVFETVQKPEQFSEAESKPEKMSNDETESEPSNEPIPFQEMLKKTPAKVHEPKIEEEIAFFPPKPSVIKKRESLKRKQAAPRVVESVVKNSNPSPLYKPIKLSRAISAPVNGAANEEPQCAIYARVIDQIKKRVQESSNPESKEEINGENGETKKNGQIAPTVDAQETT